MEDQYISKKPFEFHHNTYAQRKWKSIKDPNNYRPVALASCLYKLLECLVLNRMIYAIESRNIFQDNQSAYRTARGTLDPLMRLVAKINNGFQNSLSTLAINWI